MELLDGINEVVPSIWVQQVSRKAWKAFGRTLAVSSCILTTWSTLEMDVSLLDYRFRASHDTSVGGPAVMELEV